MFFEMLENPQSVSIQCQSRFIAFLLLSDKFRSSDHDECYFDYGEEPKSANIMLLLTNCELHTAKYSDRSTKNLKSEYFPYGTNNWLIRVLLHSHHKVVGKFSGN